MRYAVIILLLPISGVGHAHEQAQEPYALPEQTVTEQAGPGQPSPERTRPEPINIADPGADVDRRAMLRNVNTPTPTDWRPSQAEEDGPIALTLRYRSLLRSGDGPAAYALLSPELQAQLSLAQSNSLDRQRQWYLGPIKLTRITWYPDPPGAPPGLYVAIDFASVAPDGSFQCGYTMSHRLPGTQAFSISRVDTTQIDAALATPQNLGNAVAPLPCWLGPDIVTALNPLGSGQNTTAPASYR